MCRANQRRKTRPYLDTTNLKSQHKQISYQIEGNRAPTTPYDHSRMEDFENNREIVCLSVNGTILDADWPAPELIHMCDITPCRSKQTVDQSLLSV